MASVRITHDIRYHVRNKFDAMFAERITKKRAELTTLGLGTNCYNHHIPEKYRNMAAELNADPDGMWVDPAHEAGITMSYTGLDGSQKQVTFVVPLDTPVLVPNRFGSGRWNTTPRFTLSENIAGYEFAKKIWLEIDQLEEEKKTLITTIVEGVLMQCSTLRQVLEVWPTALDFMPPGVRDLHYAKPEKRKTNPAADIQIDDSVKVALMKARMTQGT